jgi:DNA gyrase inhibitor GyrI
MKRKELDVRIMQLEPMRVARALGFGEHPENLAWDKMMAWARERGLLNGPEMPRCFGFNNPSPSAGSPQYGYEVWVTVGPEVGPEGEIGITEYAGGLYAVSRFQSEKGEDIPDAWKELVAWVERSPYRPARHQWLEEHIQFNDQSDHELILDLYMPIKK